MRKCLREIPQKSSRFRINFFCVQPNVIPECEECAKMIGRLLRLPGKRERINQPEAAEAEGPLLALVRICPVHQGSVRKFPFQRAERAFRIGMIRREKFEEGEEERRCIDMFAVKFLEKTLSFCAVSAIEDEIPYCLAFAFPACKIDVPVVLLRHADPPVDGDPAHYFGVHVVLRLGAEFPDTVIRLPPDVADMIDDALQDARETMSDIRVQGFGAEDGLQKFPVDIELRLLYCGIADAHGA